MFCPKCGNSLDPNSKFCNKCGNPMNSNQNAFIPNQNEQSSVQQSMNYQANPQQNYNYSIETNSYNQNLSVHLNGSNLNRKSDNKKKIFIGTGAGVGILVVLTLITVIVDHQRGKYYFDTNSKQSNNEIIQSTNSTTKKGKYSTTIIYDNTYSGVKISNREDASALIIKDSVSQKNNCPSEIKTVEDEIINNYGITAVNLCEMDVDFARELGNVFKKIYEEYPSVRGYITNLTLVNVSMRENYIAAFMPAFNFATSDSSSTYPWVIKTQVLLNTSYFLNKERLQSSISDGSNTGHFPKNSTIYSPVAHELGHYLSFLAMMKHYELNSILLVDSGNVNTFYRLYDDFGKGDYSLTIINEAFDHYKKDTNTTMNLDEWRGTISNYALAKDNSGNYIYDETIAESFHDVYLNGNNASAASQYIVSVLKNKLEGR